MRNAPSARYYTSLVGRWNGVFRFAITDERALASMPLATRLIGRLSALTGAMQMSTTLAGAGRIFTHTTRVKAWGVGTFTTEETIELDDDGRRYRMHGFQRAMLARSLPYEATGEIDETATRATYRLSWLGAPLVQRTHIVSEGLELVQETSWSRGEVLLRRAGTAVPRP